MKDFLKALEDAERTLLKAWNFLQKKKGNAPAKRYEDITVKVESKIRK